MKVYISVDMEGIAGIVTFPQTESGQADYGAARKWLMAETNAAIEGALEAGADEIVVNDAHGGMCNLLYDELHPAARLVSGPLKPLAMMAGIDASFAAAMFIGYHAKAGAPGVLAHTWTSRLAGLWINGVEVGEWGMNAALAGHFHVPVVLVTGDDCLVREAKAELGDIETVVVKQALSRYAAMSLPRQQVLAEIRAGAARALRRRQTISPYRPALPLELQVKFTMPQSADSAAMLPRSRRLDPLTIAYEAGDAVEMFQALYSLFALLAYT
ncbi:MAG TPA: M55 family metallopeptidase [Firmicutes bacterium]|nr:M55 family metallopeptidase [Bacillota bacterium]